MLTDLNTAVEINLKPEKLYLRFKNLKQRSFVQQKDEIE